jgi:hypothetical protein
VKRSSRSRRARLLHRVGLAAFVVGIEMIAARVVGAFDPGAKLLAGGSAAATAVFVLGAFFCLRFVAYFVVPPALAVGILGVFLPKRGHESDASSDLGRRAGIEPARPA